MIFINGKFLSQRLTGVQRTSYEIVKSIDDQLNGKNLNVIIITPKNSKRINLKNIKICKSSIRSGFIWEQFILPVLTIGSPLLNFSGSAPIFKINQYITIHDAVLFDQPFAYSFLFRNWYKFLFYVQGLISKKIFTVSNFSKQRLVFNIPYIKNKILVINNGFEHIYRHNPKISFLKKNKIKKKSFYLTVGSKNPNKNLNYIEELAKLHTKKQFVIVSNKFSSVFKGTESSLGLSNVKYLNSLTDSELVTLYSNCKALICPSSYEGFGIPLIEGLALNTEVIASDIPTHVEIAGERALYFKSNSFESLLSVFNKYISNDFKINSSDQTWRKYSWKKASKKIVNILDNS